MGNRISPGIFHESPTTIAIPFLAMQSDVHYACLFVHDVVCRYQWFLGRVHVCNVYTRGGSSGYSAVASGSTSAMTETVSDASVGWIRRVSQYTAGRLTLVHRNCQYRPPSTGCSYYNNCWRRSLQR